MKGYTAHGHRIDGVEPEGPPPNSRARCGGAGICDACSREYASQRMRYGAPEYVGKHRKKTCPSCGAPMKPAVRGTADCTRCDTVVNLI